MIICYTKIWELELYDKTSCYEYHFKSMCLTNFYMVSVMGKVEGQGESWHGHVTAVTVSPEYRRQQLAKKLMNLLEDISDKM